MNQDNSQPLVMLCQQIKMAFGNGAKNYGEAVRSLNSNQGSNYITIDNSEQCSVNDTYNQTIFYVRDSADAETVSGGGNNLRLMRTVQFTLAANTSSVLDEYKLINIINAIPKLEYRSTSFDQDSIATNYFGLTERNTDSAFFLISFTMLETINCKLCK